MPVPARERVCRQGGAGAFSMAFEIRDTTLIRYLPDTDAASVTVPEDTPIKQAAVKIFRDLGL